MITLHSMAVDSFAPMLESLGEWLDKGAAHAARHKLDLIHARLTPDMYTLAQQVQLACHHARDAIGRLKGEPPADVADVADTWPGLAEQLASTLALLRNVSTTALVGSDERDCSIATTNGPRLVMNGVELLRAWALPHFYFHVVTAYGILRHNGVVLGKRDYLSQVGVFMEPKRS